MMFTPSLKHVIRALFFAISSVNAVLLTDLTAVSGKSYDFLIVGAGTGGNVVANRLSEIGNCSVLVLEAGINDLDIPSIAIPLFGPVISPNKPWTWNYTVATQTALDDRMFSYQRGRLLGGSSSINYMIINKGSMSDWDRIASETGDAGWSYHAMKRYFKKWEKWVPPQDGHNTTGQYTPASHGFDGPIHVSLPNYDFPAHKLLIKAASEVEGFSYTEDVNAGTQLGIGWAPGSTGGGMRWSSATGYLHANNTINRPNLDVLIGAQVTKLTFSNSSSLTVTGVEYSAGPGRPIYTVSARKETILSAGAFGSPQILQLSGIGHPKDLAAVGLKTVHNLTAVGSNLQDHPLLSAVYKVNSTNTGDHDLFYPSKLQTSDLASWTAAKKGPMSMNAGGVVGWARIPSDDPIFETYPDPSSGPSAPHVEFATADSWLSAAEDPPTDGNYMTIVHSVVSPASRGTIKLASSDPFQYPIIDLGLYTNPYDMAAMRSVVKSTRKYLDAPALKGFLGARYGASAAANTDDEIDEFIKGYSTTLWHASGTVAMSKQGASIGALDPDLTVKGVKNLRVVDASSFPYVPAGHPQGFIYSLAEAAADRIKDSHALHN